MKNLKKVLIALVVVMMLTACGGQKNNDEANNAVEDGTIRVASYNIDAKAKNKPEDQSKVLADNKVDIAGLQEVDNNTKRNPLDVLAGFKSDTYIDSFFSNAIEFQGGEYGIGIISRFDLSDTSGNKLFSDEFAGADKAAALAEAYKNNDPEDPETDKALDAIENPVEPRMLQRVVFNVGDKKVAFYNTHLSFEDTGLREKQLKEIKDTLDKDEIEYKIIVGDFNVDQRDDELDFLTEDYSLANGKDGKWIDTFVGEDEAMKNFAIDNIIVSKNIEITNVEAVKTEFSDHQLLFADLKLN